MRRTAWLIFAVVMFACAPLSLSSPRSWSSWSSVVTVGKADAAVVFRHGWRGYRVYGTYGHARRVYRRAWRRGVYVVPRYYGHPDGLGGYPYSAGHYAYRHVWAPPVRHWWHNGGWSGPGYGGGGWRW